MLGRVEPETVFTMPADAAEVHSIVINKPGLLGPASRVADHTIHGR